MNDLRQGSSREGTPDRHEKPEPGPTGSDRDDPRRERSFVLLLACFFLSGFAGLVYETAWTRQFSFVFGTSNLAVATVLAAYMGGLAGGAAVAARFANRIRRPVLTYGVLELGIGLAALAVPYAIGAARWLYVGLLGGRDVLPDDGGLTTALFYLACSFLILMVPTGMMGATLPLLTRHAVRSDADVSRRTGLLYATNTAGAVVGTLAAAFLLLPEVGLGRTIQIAALVNGIVFLAAWGLARSAAAPLPLPQAGARAGVAQPRGRWSWILPLILGSGAASFTYEVTWVRLLEHLLGSSIHAFATMLASFLLGIALGSAIASRFGTTREAASRGFVATQLAIAVTSAAAFLTVGHIHDFTAPMSPTSLLAAGDVIASMLTLFPAATFIGATFPLAVRILARSEAEAGPATALVYAANTFGSIAGAVGAGFLVVPLLGYAGTFATCVFANLLLAGIAAVAFRPRRPVLAGIAAVGAVLCVAVRLPTPWSVLMSSPMGKSGASIGKVEYYGVGRAATVLLLAAPAGWFLRTNGLPEATIDTPGVAHNRLSPARWLGMLPVLARPSARSMMVVGLGGGVVVEAAPSTLERVDVVELEQEVVTANRAIAERRWRDPLADPRVRLHVNDARNALLLTDRKYDAIVSQPSHPWAGSAAHLYTREFFELVRSRLGDDGVFVQWIGLAFVDRTLFGSLLATLGSVFEHVQAYQPGGSAGIVFIASAAPLDLEQNAERALLEAPEDFRIFGLRVPEDLRASLMLDERGAQAIGRGMPLNRDDRNLLQTRSPRLGDRSLQRSGTAFVHEPDVQPQWPRSAASGFYVLDRLPLPRAKQLAAGLADPDDREAAQALIAMRWGRRQEALERLEALLARAPRHEQARALRLRWSTSELLRGDGTESLVAPPLDETERAVVAGWRASASGDNAALRALDASLAAVPVRHLLQPEAVRLRAEWRIRSRNPERAREAAALVDRELWGRANPRDPLLRARACFVSGESAAALVALQTFVRQFDPKKAGHVRLGRRALALLRAIPQQPETAQLRSQLRRALRARLS